MLMTVPVLSEPTEGFVDMDGARLHYLDWGGEGPHTHFLHGNGFCAGTYTPFIRHLTPGLRVIASDVRGHGGSEFRLIERIRHWKVFAEDLRRLIQRILEPPIVGMGQSLGAVATCIAAADYPELFSSLVLINPVLLPQRRLWAIAVLRSLGLGRLFPPAALAKRRRRLFRDKAEALRLYLSGRGIFKRWSPEFVEAYLECGLLEKDGHEAVLRCDPELEAQIFESVPVDVWSYIGRIKCPMLVLRGSQSDVFLPEAAERLKRAASDSEVVVIPDTGHFPSMEKPAECAEAIRSFLQRKDNFERSGSSGRSWS
jgi:pimeloyl-ACP methyl ester carboxylesterase